MNRTHRFLPPCCALCLLGALLAADPLPVDHQPLDPGPPRGLEVEPNAIQDQKRPMVIRVRGIYPGESVCLQVLQDCIGADDRPDLQGTAGCKSPLLEWGNPDCQSPLLKLESAQYDAEGVSYRLDFQALREQGSALPEDRKLWLRVSRKGSSQALYALFGLVKDPCSLWQSVLDTFKRSPCRVGLIQALPRHRGAARWDGDRFEVRYLELAKGPSKLTSVLGTREATGLAWLDDRTLLVTVAPATGPSRLLRVPLSGGSAVTLWEAPCGDVRSATAPLALPSGRIAFVRQARDDSSGLLSVWDNGKLDPAGDLELPGGIHQLAAADPDGKEILALTLGTEENQPAFLRIDLAARSVENLGFDPALYQAVFSSPEGDRSIIAFEDNSGQRGWDLVLVNSSDKLVREVQTRPQDDLLPAWQPNGGGIAFLAEVEEEGKKP